MADPRAMPSEATDAGRIVACRLGRVPYGPAWDLQARVQARLIAAHRGQAPPAPHVLLLLEHPPVVTLGKSGDARHLLVDETALAARGIEVHRIDRGGDVTYHGPGQLVAYPVFDLNRLFTDVHRYLRELEEAVIEVCALYGLRAGRLAGRTGVWVGSGGEERKICAMGIRISRWVTMHGLALNVSTELTHFDVIVPCGIADRGVTSLTRETGRPLDIDRVASALAGAIAGRFGLPVTLLDAGESDHFLDALLQPFPGFSPRAGD